MKTSPLCYLFRRLLSLIALFLLVSNGSAATLNVPGEYGSIQAAINDANDADTVVVAPGTYFENLNFLGKAITVRSTDPNDPNTVAATILDGSQPDDPNFGSVVIFNSGETNDSVLSGFTIRNGTGSWILVSWEFKGLFWNRCGGGAVCYNMSEPTISRNRFEYNSAGQGGGIYVYGDPVNPFDPSDPPVHVQPVIDHNAFEFNAALEDHGYLPPDNVYPHNDHGDGGAIVGFQGVDATITHNILINNQADLYGGGIHLRQWSNGIFSFNQVIQNDSALGAGLHITYLASPTISDNLIESNMATGLGGGGIYIYYFSNPIIERNTISGNSSSTGGGIGMFWESKPVVRNNLIYGNLEGAGIHVRSESVPEISHNTIFNNKGGIQCQYGAMPLIENNIIASNNTYGLSVDPSCVADIHHNNIWNHPSGNYSQLPDLTGVDGNISIDPDFIDAAGADFRLDIASGCINTGDPNAIIPAEQTDFYDQPRRLGQYTDMGANEAYPVWNLTQQTQHTAIQEAIDASVDGDTIVTGRGRYFETINFVNHQIVLRSPDPNDWEVVQRTIIDAENTETTVVIAGGQNTDTVLAGFTITGGNALGGHAGGIRCYASPTITRNIVTGNHAYYKGGGLYFWSVSATPVVRDNRIINNTSVNAGGIFCDTASSPFLEGNYIAHNEASYGGGVVYSGNTGTPEFRHNTLVGNYAAIRGGGLLAIVSSVKILNNFFIDNNAASGSGGAAAFSGGNPLFVNNTLTHNGAAQAGGIYCFNSSLPLIANNIIANTTQGTGIFGTADTTATILNNNLFANSDGSYDGILTDLTGIDGNISADPNFTDSGFWQDNGTPADPNDDTFVPGNYHLRPGSPCIDAGRNDSVPAQLTEDFEGESRILAGTVDIGADEIDLTPIPADFNGNWAVAGDDLVVFLAAWLDEGPALPADFNGDQIVNQADWALFIEYWLWQAPWLP